MATELDSCHLSQHDKLTLQTKHEMLTLQTKHEMGSWKVRIRSDADADTDTDTSHFKIYTFAFI